MKTSRVRSGAPMRPRGFTLIELVVVIAVIAILAALLVPTILGQAERSRLASERSSLNELAKAIQRFRTETGYMPVGGRYLVPGEPEYMGIDGTEFAASDTALFTLPNNVPYPQCDPNDPTQTGQPCWGGPYLSAVNNVNSLAGMRDAWGQQRLFSIIPPGGAFPNGAYVVWSRGPDRQDQTGCTDGGCSRDVGAMAAGRPSVPGADDIVVLVGAVR